jgi:hypothetical protein
MNVGNIVFSQLMSFIPDYELRKCVDRYRGDFHTRRFTCRDQFLVMSYAQFTSSAHNPLLSHSVVAKIFSTLMGNRGKYGTKQ